jgi:hypothetical protein
MCEICRAASQRSREFIRGLEDRGWIRQGKSLKNPDGYLGADSNGKPLPEPKSSRLVFVGATRLNVWYIYLIPQHNTGSHRHWFVVASTHRLTSKAIVGSETKVELHYLRDDFDNILLFNYQTAIWAARRSIKTIERAAARGTI